MAVDYYATLGVARDATASEVKKAFRKVARQTHPDANPDDPEADQRFRAAAEAYEVLSDPESRRRYDRGDTIDLSSLFGGSGGLDDLLRSVFGESGLFGSPSRRPARGRDVLVRVEIDLADAAFGVDVPIQFQTRRTCEECTGSGAARGSRRQTCPQCGGAGSVRVARRSLFGTMMTVSTCSQCAGDGVVISELCPVCAGLGWVSDDADVTVEVPAGIVTGTKLRLSGRGESGGRSGPAGDLFVEVAVAPHNEYERVDDDLVLRANVGIAEATLGTRLTVPLIEGGDAEVDVPSGTQPGTVFKISGAGMTRLGRRSRGDLHVIVGVDIAETLTREEEELLRKWAELRGEKTGKAAPAG
ncbi:MAG: DnaJ domain-containing protein [Acidobacteria bacterium]|nr:DnaJ domain-containing protein [Acidobacteriota bacterium]MCZ6662667.1 DnaJ domain-containing protein [Actinomycetota bacterium]